MTSTPRHNIYAFIHKGLRAFMTHALVRVGRLDALDAAEVAEVSEELRALILICRGHLEHEDAVIHVAMQERAPGSCAEVAADHIHHRAALAELEALVGRLSGDQDVARDLYQALTRFIVENFEHMQVEESEHNAVLWATHTDDEIRALEHRIVSSLTPEESTLAMRWMLPHLAPHERAGLLGGMRSKAPAEVFEGVLSLVRPLLGGRDWRKLSLAIGL